MRLLMISTDKKILEEGSAAQKRHFEYGKICDELHIIVLQNANQLKCESECTRIPHPAPHYKGGERKNVRIYGVKGCNKIERLRDGYKKAMFIVKNGKPHLAYPSKGEEIKFVVTTQDAGFTGLIGCLLKRKYGVKLNVQIHGKEEKFINKILLFPFQKIIIRSADSIRVVSERLKRWVVDEYGVDNKIIFKIPIYTELELRIKNQELRDGNEIEVASCRNGALPRSEKGKCGEEKSLNKESMEFGNAEDGHRSQFTILTVGRLVKVKNIALQIEALADVIKIFPNTKLVIVGDGPEKNNLQKIVKKFKVEDNVEFAGWVENWDGMISEQENPTPTISSTGCLKSVIPSGADRSREISLLRKRLISEKGIPSLTPPSFGRDDKKNFLDTPSKGRGQTHTDLFVLTSDAEGWGMVIIEAMAAGLPIIMTAVGCAGEVVKNGENGLVIPIGDKKALIASICEMITDNEKREKISKNAKITVDNLLDKNKTLEMYREMWWGELSHGN